MSVGERREEIRLAIDREARAKNPPRRRPEKREAAPTPPPPAVPERIREACAEAVEGFDLEQHAANIAAAVRSTRRGG